MALALQETKGQVGKKKKGERVELCGLYGNKGGDARSFWEMEEKRMHMVHVPHGLFYH